MITVLVTGAKGALGKAVTQYLNKQDGYNIVTTGRSGKDTDFQLDITDIIKLTKIIDQVRPNLIIQLAATFTHDFDDAYAVNVQANRELLELIQRTCSDTRVLLIGSAAEYGVIEVDENPVSEEHALNPVSVYGLTKVWQTQLAGFYSRHGVDVVVARVFNLKGKGLSEKLFVGRLQKQINAVLSGEQSVIELGPLSATRDYISTEDAVLQLFDIAEFGETGHVYHVASGKPVVMRELLKGTLDEYGLDLSVVHEAEEKSNRSGYDVPVIYADMTRTSTLNTR